MWASYNGNLEVVKALLLAGADAEAEDYVSGGVEIVGILVVDWSEWGFWWLIGQLAAAGGLRPAG